MPRMFCEESLGKIIDYAIQSFSGTGSVGPRILSLESVDYFEQVKTSVVEKKKNLHQQNFNGEANWSVLEHTFKVQENGGTKGEVVP